MDGPAKSGKSESPVENGGKHPITFGLQHVSKSQIGVAGFRWPTHRSLGWVSPPDRKLLRVQGVPRGYIYIYYIYIYISSFTSPYKYSYNH